MKTMIRTILAVVLIFSLSACVFAQARAIPSDRPKPPAQPIELNTPVNGQLASAKDILCYSFFPPANGYIQIEFGHELKQEHAKNWEIALYGGWDEPEYLICPLSTVYADEAFVSPQIGVESIEYDYGRGEYYICISAAEAFDASEFTLTVHYTADENWEIEPNFDWYFSDRYPLDKPCYGTVYDGEDIDFFSYEIKERSHVYVTFTHPDSGSDEALWDLSFSLMDVMYQLEPGATIRGDQMETVVDLGVVYSGILYIQVSGSWVDEEIHFDSSAYSVSVHAEPTDSFPDVPADAYYAKAVEWAITADVTEGTSRYTFSPEAACTRAQIVTFLWRVGGYYSNLPEECAFTDVEQGTYYYEPVLWANVEGIAHGTSETTFSPQAACTRAQAVTFLWRMAGSPTAENRTNQFTDVSEDAYYFEAMLWAIENGITLGTSETTFSPDDICNRAQIVTFLYRYIYMQ